MLAQRPEVALLDYTGSTEFGDWLERNSHALVYTEKAGVNSVVIDSTDDLKGMARNLAMSLSLYSGQMCTTPQNLFVPRDGIMRERRARRVRRRRRRDREGASTACSASPSAPAGLLGAIATDATLRASTRRTRSPASCARSAPVPNAEFPDARTRSPLVAVVDAADRERYDREAFGPIAFIVRTAGHRTSRCGWRPARRSGSGAITAIVYTTDDAVLAKAAALGARRQGEPRGEPHRHAARQPVGGVQRLSRDGREPGRQRVAHRRRVRREPVPHHRDAHADRLGVPTA